MTEIKTIDDLINIFEAEYTKAKNAEFEKFQLCYGFALAKAKELKAAMNVRHEKLLEMLDYRIALRTTDINGVSIDDFKERQYRIGRKHEAQDIAHELRMMEIDYGN